MEQHEYPMNDKTGILHTVKSSLVAEGPCHSSKYQKRACSWNDHLRACSI